MVAQFVPQHHIAEIEGIKIHVECVHSSISLIRDYDGTGNGGICFVRRGGWNNSFEKSGLLSNVNHRCKEYVGAVFAIVIEEVKVNDRERLGV